MFEFAGGRKATESKCYVTHGTMGHLDPKQPPVKRKPYAAILAVPFVHKVSIPQHGEGMC
jgi:ribonucleases P/MRP protein subunit RPP40